MIASDRERIDRYHAHLDACARCRQNPFDLCVDGVRLLRETMVVWTDPAPEAWDGATLAGLARRLRNSADAIDGTARATLMREAAGAVLARDAQKEVLMITLRAVEWIPRIGSITGEATWECPSCHSGVVRDGPEKPSIDCHMAECGVARVLRGVVEE